jgi:hypothetical protein
MNSLTQNLEQTNTTLNLYQQDFFAWTKQQINYLQNQQWNQLDLAHLIEEIETLGKQQHKELRNRLSILIGHLLKWEYQPQKRSHSWLATLRVQRIDIQELIDDNPSLKPYLEEALTQAYIKGLLLAVSETNLPDRTFPQNCPYSLTEILSDRFYPGQPNNLTQE